MNALPVVLWATKGDYSTGAAQVIMPHVLGTIEVYEQQTSWESVLENSDIIVLWSANPLHNHAYCLDVHRPKRD